jgi:hypothetical protein
LCVRRREYDIDDSNDQRNGNRNERTIGDAKRDRKRR